MWLAEVFGFWGQVLHFAQLLVSMIRDTGLLLHAEMPGSGLGAASEACHF